MLNISVIFMFCWEVGNPRFYTGGLHRFSKSERQEYYQENQTWVKVNSKCV